jgi:hypothetical protein
MGEKGNVYRIMVGMPEGRDHSEDQVISGWKILSWIFGGNKLG